MKRKTAVFGAVLLLAGAGALGWVISEQRKDERLQQQQRERLRSNLDRLDKIMEDPWDLDPRQFDGIVYEEDSGPDLEQYRKREEMRATILTAGGVLALSGGTLLGWVFLVSSVRLAAGCSRTVARLSKVASRRQPESANRTEQESSAEQSDQKGSEKKPEERPKPYFAAWRDTQEKQPQKSPKSASRETGGEPSSGGATNKGHEQQQGSLPTDAARTEKNRPSSRQRSAKKKQEPATESAGKEVETDRAHADRKSAASADAESSQGSAATAETENESGDNGNGTARLEKSFKTQAENLEQQMAEFKQMAEAVRQTAMTQSRPVENSIKQLAEQVSAIRDYAAHQQERVKKLQDGYDWGIIRNFCLRVIRCIDNIDVQIESLSQQGEDTTHLEEVRDELIFALESTGVECFEPQINSDYRGQEKNSEAIKDREACDDAELVGKIASVVRRGYQYCIDDENVKTVRPAQVKLFGQAG